MADQPIKHGHQHRFKGPDPIQIGNYEIKLFPDQELATILGMSAPVVVGSDLFTFMIPEDLHSCRLRYCDAYLSTPAAGAVVSMVRNVDSGEDLLEPPGVSVPGGAYSSRTTPSVPVQGAGAECAWGDRITIDVTAAGSGGWGLGLILEFSV